MEKVIRDGKVAVLLSDYYWYTLHEKKVLLFHPLLVELVELGSQNAISVELIAKLLGENTDFTLDLTGVKHLRIQWIPVGSVFKIIENQGFETVEYLNDQNWITA